MELRHFPSAVSRKTSWDFEASPRTVINAERFFTDSPKGSEGSETNESTESVRRISTKTIWANRSDESIKPDVTIVVFFCGPNACVINVSLNC